MRDDRATLAAPVDGRLFFAGEATSSNFFTTAHGAQESGVRAAKEVMAALIDCVTTIVTAALAILAILSYG